MRFDAPEHVQTWRDTGRYPAVHDRIATIVREEVAPADGPILDLCSSTGLLGRRLTDDGYRVVAVQEPGPAAALGHQAGVYDPIPLLNVKITASTLGVLGAWIERHGVTMVVARRCFPELWDELGDTFTTFVELLPDLGVERVILEGRVASARSTHPLSTVAREVAALGPTWRPTRLAGPVAVLVV